MLDIGWRRGLEDVFTAGKVENFLSKIKLNLNMVVVQLIF